MKVGAIDILPVLDGSILARLPATKPFPDQDSEAWREQHGIFRPDGLIESTLGGFVIRAGERLLLVDAGGGPEPDGGYAPPVIDVDDDADPFVTLFRERGVTGEMLVHIADHFSATQMVRGRLPSALGTIGVRQEDVTDLVFTHLHFDHIGWASAGGTAFFPNATVRCAAADLDHFLAGAADEDVTSLVYRTPAAPERLGPVLDRIETWESDGPIAPGVDVRLAPGHTPGSSVVVVSDGDERAMLLGDMVHCPLELTDDDFDLLVDHDQELANRVREAYARELEGSDVPVVAAHFPGLQFGRLLPGDGGRRWAFDGGTP